MQKRQGQQFCAQHSTAQRMPCPLDPHHSIWTHQLQSHLQKCNAKATHDPWFSKDFNSQLRKVPSDTKSEPTSTESEGLEVYINTLQGIEFAPLPFSVKTHPGLNQRLADVQVAKHPLQQASLVGNLKQRGLLNSESFYLEFGCGKAELSRFISLCITKDFVGNDDDCKRSDGGYGFGLIDRGANRMKNDAKIIKEAIVTRIPHVKRSRIDIKDLDLDKFLVDCKFERIVVVSKHLCGAATDLTLKLVLNSEVIANHQFGGVLIAMCCRHVCEYHQLLPESKQYLKTRGFPNSQSFESLKKMTSWAVSGKRLEQMSDPDIHGTDGRQKITLGLMARRLIDESRVYALQQLLPAFHIDLFHYVESHVTLENVALCITAK